MLMCPVQLLSLAAWGWQPKLQMVTRLCSGLSLSYVIKTAHPVLGNCQRWRVQNKCEGGFNKDSYEKYCLHNQHKALEGLSGLLGSDLNIRSFNQMGATGISERALRFTSLGFKCCVAGDDVLMDSPVLFFKTLLWRVTMITVICNSYQKWEEELPLYAERHSYQKVKCILNFIPFMESVAWNLASQ